MYDGYDSLKKLEDDRDQLLMAIGNFLTTQVGYGSTAPSTRDSLVQAFEAFKAIKAKFQ